MKRVIAAVGLSVGLLVGMVGAASASVPVKVSLTQCVFEGNHISHGSGSLFDAADSAYALQTTQANGFYLSNYHGWVDGCEARGYPMERIWFTALERYRPAAEVAYIEALTP